MRARRCKAIKFGRRFAADRDGAVAIEFAFAGTIALALIFAAIDVGRLFIVNGLLGDAARQISRENQVRLSAYSSAEFNA
ncbi:MAG: pilus assembly protein, partial [Alphaproteobacteria bacterium]